VASSHWSSIFSALVCASTLACSPARSEPATRPPHELIVTAADFHFRAPQSVPAGITRIRLKNDGPEFHHVQLVRLDKGHTVRELMDRLAKGDFSAPWATFVGGPEAPMPGRETEVTLGLTEGQYVMICVISSPPDHVPHVAKGMALPLTVTAAKGPRAKEPEADVRLVLNDYSFATTPAISAGRRTIRVENAAAQPHHVDIVKLAPGKTAQDALAWSRTHEGPPPAELFGGATAIAPGQVNFVTADFTPGDYAFFCFVPDAKDGKSHVAHGMVRQIRVE
jgi:hypothetical protein